MPRLAPALLREACSKHTLLPLLLRECRDLPSARNELRWLKEYAYQSHGLPTNLASIPASENELSPSNKLAIWQTLCRYAQRRARGEPLQYMLGSQPFGDLDVLCRSDVLIPRPETEAYTARLAAILKTYSCFSGKKASKDSPLRILDLCSGTGCISLLLHSTLKPPGLASNRSVEIVGVDVSDAAVALARENIEHNIGENLLDLSAVNDISFMNASILDLLSNPNASQNVASRLSKLASKTFDVVISNPPYISQRDYRPGGKTTRSVRKFEPKLALVPNPRLAEAAIRGRYESRAQDGDAFYQPLHDIAEKVNASIVVLETGDHHQALRVHRLAANRHRRNSQPTVVELWDDDAEDVELANSARHRARSVVVWTGEAAQARKAEKSRLL